MTVNASGSAKIYTFPLRGRFALGGMQEDAKAVTNVRLPRGVIVASGSGWYHDEAIQEAMKAEPGRKN